MKNEVMKTASVWLPTLALVGGGPAVIFPQQPVQHLQGILLHHGAAAAAAGDIPGSLGLGQTCRRCLAMSEMEKAPGCPFY